MIRPQFGSFTINQTFLILLRPICLPTTANEDFKDAEFTIAGFGKTELLDNSRTKLKTDVRSISNAECQKLNTNQLDINSNQMCALGEDGKDLWLVEDKIR